METSSQPLLYSVYDTAIGDVTIVANEKYLVRLYVSAVDPEGMVNDENAILYDAIIELNQYYYGQRKSFDLRLKPEGSDFEKKVWDYVISIPYGQTKSFEQVAKALNEDSVAQVADAIFKNPLPFFIPTHRVVGKQRLSHETPDSIELIKKILNMEKVNSSRVFVAPQDYKDEE
jgi:methylated-DNA-[protein]-cysteine S-methyltransferase